MIRPESFRLVPPQGASLTGEVSAVSFVGDRQRLTIAGAAERPLIADVPNLPVVKVGERVGLAVEPSAIRVLPKDT
jgi:ABC-type Fe3+/spermidine/putrescine transport system ATPase subunit